MSTIMKRAAVIISITVALHVACDQRSPTSPVQPVGPVGVPPVAAVGLGITGNTSLKAVNDTSQLAAIVRFADGTSNDLASMTQWDTYDHAVALVAPSGLLKALAFGETTVTATYANLHASATLQVLPEGTFILKGSVWEPGLPLAGATVTITQGRSEGASTVTTTPGGTYAFYGVAGNLNVQASQAGYVTQTHSLTVAQNAVLNFTLQPVALPAQLAGVYTLTITAAPSCAGFPSDAARRTYTATLSQQGPRVEVVLSGSNFFTYPYTSGPQNHFSGRVTGDIATVAISHDDEYDVYDIVESLGGTRYLALAGMATMTVTPSGLSGTLTGALNVVAVPGPYFWQKTVLAVCTADHGFVFDKTATMSRAARTR